MGLDSITIVSGLPRSGTSLMMQMCAAGGLEPLTDHVRRADEDNLHGYYEYEKVKKLERDKSWLPDAKGKVVKVITMLLKHLPPDFPYKVLFMLRNVDEIIASQQQMLTRRKEPTDSVPVADLATLYENHIRKIETWLAQQPNFEVLYINYNRILNNPRENVKEIRKFLGNALDEEKMTRVIDKNSYRQRLTS